MNARADTAEVIALRTELATCNDVTEAAVAEVGELMIEIAALRKRVEAADAMAEAAECVRRDAKRQDVHGMGALNDVVTPYRIDELAASLAAYRATGAA